MIPTASPPADPRFSVSVKDNILSRVFTLFLVILVVIVLVAVYALGTINRSVASSDWVNHSYATIYELEGVVSSLQVGEGYMHTYAQTGDPRDLVASRNSFTRLEEHFETVKALMRDDTAAAKTLLRIEAQTQAREVLAQAVWTARSANQPEKIRALLEADAGSPVVTAIERELGKLRAAQFELLSERDHVAYVQAQTTRWVVGVGIALNFCLLVGVGWLLRDDLAARRRAATALAEANVQLEEKVRARTAEIEAANARLQVENWERKWTIASQEHQLRYNRLIVESVNDLVFVITKARNITRINPAVVHQTGLNNEAILMKPLGLIVEVAPDPVTGLDPIVRALADGRELINHAAVVLGQDERRIPAWLTLVPLRDQNMVVGAVAIVQVAFSAATSEKKLLQ